MPKKPKTNPETKTAPKAAADSALQVSSVPDWVDFHPRADFRLVAWESDESTVEVVLTSDEYCALKDHLARLRGIALVGEVARA
jgi:hypothetical protein